MGNRSGYKCDVCFDAFLAGRGVERRFWTEKELVRHQELRHQGRARASDKPKRPKAHKGSELEVLYLKLNDEIAFASDMAHEWEARQQALVEDQDRLCRVGNLDLGTGKRKKTGQYKAQKSRRPAPGKPKPGTVKRKGNKGKDRGAAPPGKPYWDTRHGRWTAKKPETTKRRSDEATKQKTDETKAEDD